MVDVASKLRKLLVQCLARQAQNAEQPRQTLPDALLSPVQGRALGVSIDDKHPPPASAPGTGQVQGEGRFADAALLVEQGDDHRRPPAGGRLDEAASVRIPGVRKNP